MASVRNFAAARLVPATSIVLAMPFNAMSPGQPGGYPVDIKGDHKGYPGSPLGSPSVARGCNNVCNRVSD